MSGLSWDEIDAAAREFDQPAQHKPQRDPNAPQPAHAIADTDLSDQRRYRIGLSNVDARLGPLRPGGFTVIGARPGFGKTSLAEMIATSNAAHARVLFATLEMMPPEIRDSILARHLGITLDGLERMIEQRDEEYDEARAWLAGLHLNIWRPAPRRPRTAEAIIEVALADRADLLVIDYTRNIARWTSGDVASGIVETLSQAAKENAMHIVLLAQLKIDATHKRPTVDMLQDTTRLEQEADKVLLLHRPFAGEKTTIDNIAEIIVPKNRRGRLFKEHVKWNGPFRSFYPMDDVENAAAPCCQPKKSRKSAEPSPEPDDDEYISVEDAKALF